MTGQKGVVRGRPKKESSKSCQYRLRMDPDEKAVLDEISVHTGKSRSEILRDALKMYYNLSRYND